ncbi:hypothetical protein S245_027143, partial [Arachis hypogaea]
YLEELLRSTLFCGVACGVSIVMLVEEILRYIRIKKEDYFNGITLLILVCYKLEHRIEERNPLLFHHWPIFGIAYFCSLFIYRTSCL